MKKWIVIGLLGIGVPGWCQVVTIKDKLTQGMEQLEADPQLKHAIVGFCVADARTGEIVYEHNAEVGLAPASTQKLFTSCAAFELLGKNFRYTTDILYKQFKPVLSRSYFVIKPSGDPTFGSARFDSTRPATILKNIARAVQQRGIMPVSSQYVVFDSTYEKNAVPGGWIWEDIGNYYGAAAQGFNWMENQYDIILKSGNSIGSKVSAIKTIPGGFLPGLEVNVKAAEKKSGDKTIVYLNYGFATSSIQGTIPVGEDSFAVSASIADPKDVFLQQFTNSMKTAKITMFYGLDEHPPLLTLPDSLFNEIKVYRHISPPLDSINYWFLKKSINLYGEALIKTIAFQKTGFASTAKGVELVKEFWEDNDIDQSALHICDGSGLSPQNRVTTSALVQVLQYAKKRPWYNSFYFDLPEYNGMKMKSGSIAGARAYAGYQTAGDGKQYCFSIIINNYDGVAGDVVKKMYKLLDLLK